MSSPILPAEGFTVEVVAKAFRAVFLQPLFTAGLVLASVQPSPRYHQILSTITTGRVSPATFDRSIKILFAAGVLYRLNNLLTKSVLNNFISDTSWDWQKEIVLVTGGCSGIGQLVVQDLSERGIQVVILDVADPPAALGQKTRYYKVDVTSSSAIHEAAERIRREVGHPSVLVNNAGVGFNNEILEGTEDQLRLTFNVNIIAHFLLVREFLPDMIQKNHGNVVTVASLASFVSQAGNVDYACTKAAALAFHEGLASELKSRYGAPKVKTTTVHPTWTRTPLIHFVAQRRHFKEFILEPTTVASAIVSQILKGESAQLILPGRWVPLSGLRGWPSWLQEGLRNSVAQMLSKS